jgi:hypothetical protein
MTDVTGVNEVTRVDCDGCPVWGRDDAYGAGTGRRGPDPQPEGLVPSECADCVIGLLLDVAPQRPHHGKRRAG